MSGKNPARQQSKPIRIVRENAKKTEMPAEA
jgi:hypothetical protein